MLDDGVLRRPSVDKCDSIQCDTNTNEVEYLVNKGTGGCKKKEGRQSMANFIIPKVMTDLRKLTGKTYPQDMMTAPSSSANLIVLFHHFRVSVPCLMRLPKICLKTWIQSQKYVLVPPTWTLAIMRPGLQNRKLLIKVAIDEWQERENREEDIRHE